MKRVTIKQVATKRIMTERDEAGDNEEYDDEVGEYDNESYGDEEYDNEAYYIENYDDEMGDEEVLTEPDNDDMESHVEVVEVSGDSPPTIYSSPQPLVALVWSATHGLDIVFDTPRESLLANQTKRVINALDGSLLLDIYGQIAATSLGYNGPVLQAVAPNHSWLAPFNSWQFSAAKLGRHSKRPGAHSRVD